MGKESLFGKVKTRCDFFKIRNTYQEKWKIFKSENMEFISAKLKKMKLYCI